MEQEQRIKEIKKSMGMKSSNEKDLEEGNNKEKKFKLPSKAKGKSKIKKNYVLTIYVQKNKNIDFRLLPLNNGKVYYKPTDSFYSVTNRHIGFFKNYPAILIVENLIEPLLLDDIEGIDLDLQRIQKIMIQIAEDSQIDKKSAFGGKGLLFILLGLAVAGYIIYSSSIG